MLHLSSRFKLYFSRGVLFKTNRNNSQELGVELRSLVRDDAGCIPVVHPWHGQGSSHVPTQVSAVITICASRCYYDRIL